MLLLAIGIAFGPTGCADYTGERLARVELELSELRHSQDPVGRYQLCTVAAGDERPRLFKIDTVSGQTWLYREMSYQPSVSNSPAFSLYGWEPVWQDFRHGIDSADSDAKRVYGTGWVPK